ncbi:Phosphoribosylglycinamide formyltransferase 2 [Prochlorococcus sp. MIT 0601]|nr:Phosphoribosylglycinamide formyltransferase 2 [Prochlorococcus sp. MIT 0601]
MLLGSGELGKEVSIAAKRLGCNVIACDRYPNAPAMQVADQAEVLNMSDSIELKQIIRKHKPDVVIPEIEALAVNVLHEIESEGITVIPNAEATSITMNRDKIRNLASTKLGLKTAKFAYATNSEELKSVVKAFEYPILIKPVMSSSGKGQSLVKEEKDLLKAWQIAIDGARGVSNKVIVEEFISFDLEITLLTIRQKNGNTIFCPPIAHLQKDGDYQSSWQPAEINKNQLEEAKSIAKTITQSLGGVGLFGVEFFITKDGVVFSELSPRPHDTGLVTLTSQNINEFELHLRAILNLPIPIITTNQPSASTVILAKDTFSKVAYTGLEKALEVEDTKVFLFGKPNCKKGRRMGIALAKGDTVEEAIKKAHISASSIKVIKGKSK